MRVVGKIVVGVVRGDNCIQDSQFISRRPH